MKYKIIDHNFDEVVKSEVDAQSPKRAAEKYVEEMEKKEFTMVDGDYYEVFVQGLRKRRRFMVYAKTIFLAREE